LTLEADNPALQQRLVEVAELRRQNLPTLPSTLALELATNPFLREHSTSIRKTLGADSYSPAQVFAKIRLLKDQFS
jgi:hydroxyacylglutathione hydrolase